MLFIIKKLFFVNIDHISVFNVKEKWLDRSDFKYGFLKFRSFIQLVRRKYRGYTTMKNGTGTGQFLD